MERIQRYISHLQGVLERLTLADVRHSIDVIMEAYYAEKTDFCDWERWKCLYSITHRLRFRKRHECPR